MRGSVVHLLLVALLVAGCSGADPQASPETTSSPPVTTSAEPSPSASEPAKHETAREFLENWPIVEHRMFVTGDTAEYRAMTVGCDPCSRLADRIEGFYANGGWVKTQPWAILSLTQLGTSRTEPTFQLKLNAGPTRYLAKADDKVQRLDGGSLVYKAYLVRDEGRWNLKNYLELAQ
jgi:hypothetical protein